MRRNLCLCALAMAAIAGAVSRRPALADDETRDVTTRITAPLEAADCAATPATITVLGLVIDVSAATIEAQSSAPPTPTPAPQPGDDGTHSHSGGGVTGGQPTGCYYYCTPSPTATPQSSASCGTLVLGQTVEVTLAGDAAPLAAIDVRQDGNQTEPELQAPVQAIDAGAITLLGLNVDVSGAGLDGSDDTGVSSQPIALTQLVTGQFVEVELGSASAPLKAAALEVKNFANQLQLDVRDANGNAIDDVDVNRDPVDDVQVDISDMVIVQSSTGVNTAPSRQLKRVRLHAVANGGLTLGGLPTGAATIIVRRLSNGVTSADRRGAMVTANGSRVIHLRLHPLRSR